MTTRAGPCRPSFTENLRWLLLDFCSGKHFFSAESGIYCWQSHRFLLRTPLKTLVKPQKQPRELFCKKGVLRNFANFTGKHRCWSLFLIELQAFRPGALSKKDFKTDVSCWIFKIFKNNQFEVCKRLLLKPLLSPGLSFLITYTSGSN